MTLALAIPVLLLSACLAIALVMQLRRRNLHRWLPGYLLRSSRRVLRRTGRPASDPVHIILCIADHFEPAAGGVSAATADARVAAWVDRYPKRLGHFRDSDGRPPRHSFFYPIDQYEAHHADALAGLCAEGYGETEIHLHHDRDTAENMERTLRRFTRLFADRHGLLGRWPDGSVAYGFIHGNWALDHSRPDGRWCGVKDELSVLRRTGCYADFTMPSAPDATQTRKINSIYYAVGAPDRCKSHDHGLDVGAARPPSDGLMLIQGPLRLWWPTGSWKPRIENGCIQRGQPPTLERLEQWTRADIHIPARPDWLFVKLHTHGATEANQSVLLGSDMARFHRALARRAASDPKFHYHYVTAREMYNLAKAAESGFAGPISEALDFEIQPPPQQAAKLQLMTNS